MSDTKELYPHLSSISCSSSYTTYITQTIKRLNACGDDAPQHIVHVPTSDAWRAALTTQQDRQRPKQAAYMRLRLRLCIMLWLREIVRSADGRGGGRLFCVNVVCVITDRVRSPVQSSFVHHTTTTDRYAIQYKPYNTIQEGLSEFGLGGVYIDARLHAFRTHATRKPVKRTSSMMLPLA